MSAIEHEPGRIPSEAVELIKSLYVVEGAMAQDHGLDYLFGNIEILTTLTRDMLHREAEHGQWIGQLDRLTARCEEMRGDEEWDCRDTDALAAVPTGNGFYDSIGAGDSVVREHIFEELCNRYGYTYDEVYDSWLHESPLPSPAISQHSEKIAVAAGYRFNLVDTRETSGIDLKGCGTVVTVDGHDYEIMKGATYEDSRKVDDLLDSHGDKPISDYRKRPQGMSLKQAVREAREASAKLAEENGGTDDPDGKDER